VLDSNSEGDGSIIDRAVLYAPRIDAFPNPKTPMEIEAEKTREDAVIKLAGRLDMNTSPDLRKAALRLYSRNKCKNLTIDFTDVSYIDTSGLATLIELLVTAKERCAQLTLCGLNEKVRYVLDVNGLTGFFRVASSLRENTHA
jgi:anti-sigma B factor antagonist